MAKELRYEAQYSILEYDYETKEWRDTGAHITADAGGWAELQTCIDKNLEYISAQIEQDANYRYIVMIIDQIDENGDPQPNSEAYGARVFNGKIVEHWDY